MRREWPTFLLLLAGGCLPAALPPGEPPLPYYMRSPALSDFEMDHARRDITEVSIAYLLEKGVASNDLAVHVWPNLGVRIVVGGVDPTDGKLGQGLVNRLHARFNDDYYDYRPMGYDFVFQVVLRRETSADK
jgi:hypothetical protein